MCSLARPLARVAPTCAALHYSYDSVPARRLGSLPWRSYSRELLRGRRGDALPSWPVLHWRRRQWYFLRPRHLQQRYWRHLQLSLRPRLLPWPLSALFRRYLQCLLPAVLSGVLWRLCGALKRELHWRLQRRAREWVRRGVRLSRKCNCV